MRFASPAALSLLLLAVPIVLLHVLRPNREARSVSSTYLWTQAPQPVSAARPWQRLRPSTLLVLQLIAIALLAIAAARPVRALPSELAQHTIFIVDASGSMEALDGAPDRLSKAKERARELHEQLPAGGIASVVEASAQPRVLLSASPDGGSFDDALDRIGRAGGTPDWAEAFTLAGSVETPEAPVGFVLLSDGGLDEDARRLIPPGTRYERIGDRATNRAITHIGLEPVDGGLLARLTLRNTGGARAEQVVRVDVDGRTVATDTVTLAAGAAVDREVAIPRGERVEALLEGEDLLDADDHVRAVTPGRSAIRVLLAGDDPLFLERFLESVPGVVVERSATSIAAPAYDLVVYDGVPVPPDPGAPFIAVAPPGGAPGVAVTGTVELPAVTLVRTDDAVLADVDLADVAIAEAQRLEPSPGDEVLVAAEGAPLLVRGTREGTRFAYLAFSLNDSNLPLQVGFPILFDRLLTDLTRIAEASDPIAVGEAIPVPGDVDALVEGPGGTRIEVPAGRPGPVADRQGFWLVSDDASETSAVIAVNAPVGESDLEPARELPVRPAPETTGTRSAPVERDVVPWVAAALLVVLAGEAWANRHRMGVGRRQARWAWAARVVVAALVAMAAAGITVPLARDRVATVFLVDGSDSMGADGRAAAVRWVQDALADQPRGSLAGVAVFGGDARLELTVQPDPTLGRPATSIDPSRTNLAGALRLAAAVLPADARRRVVVVSDGRATEGDAAAEASRLQEAGIRVDVHAVERVAGPDAAVTDIDAPARAREGELVPIRVTVAATEAGPATVTLTTGGRVVGSERVELEVGDNEVDFAVVAGDQAIERYQARVQRTPDVVPANDAAGAAIQIEGPARVLVVEGQEGEAGVLVDALRSGGLTVDVVEPGAVPPIDALAAYSSTVLADVDRRTLSAEAVRALTAATRDLGRGMVVVGGEQSYALGGYRDSDLEAILPVISDVLDPKRRASVAQVLAIDTSGSMGACHCAEGSADAQGMPMGPITEGGVNKTDIARSAAARTIEALGRNDEVGILAFNTEQDWVVDLQTLPAEDVVREGLGRLFPEGGTNLHQPLQVAAEALRESKARLKHIILFTDGFTAENTLDDLVRQARELRESGVTISVLGTGEGSSQELRAVAEAGGGRFYPGRDLEQIPQIMVQEAVLAARDFLNEGRFLPEVVGTGPAVDGLRSSPELFGFVATTAKPSARTLLRIGDDHDPLLVTWQAGLGKVTAWTSDAARRWSQAWATWDGYVPFWSAAVKDTFPTDGGQAGVISARLSGGQLVVDVESEDAWPTGATATARVSQPGGTSREVRLTRRSGTTFAGDVPAAAEGTYAVGVEVRAGADTLLAGGVVASRSYSAEYRPGDVDVDALAAVSRAGGGRGEIAPSAAFDREGLDRGRGRVALAGWLLVAAALLWPLAVALSRLALRLGAVRDSAVAERVRAVAARLPSPPAGASPTPSRPASPPTRQPKVVTPEPPPSPPSTVDRLLQRKRGDAG